MSLQTGSEFARETICLIFKNLLKSLRPVHTSSEASWSRKVTIIYLFAPVWKYLQVTSEFLTSDQTKMMLA